MQTNLDQIVDYYNTCESDYRTFWDLDRSMAMHAGFWDQQTTSLAEALARENEILAQYAHITSQDRVLDAGCGIGGSSLFLAKTFGCKVTGITLSDHQVQIASENAKKYLVDHLVNFQTMDFCHTDFPNASFDVIWGIESICHAEDKAEFIKEAYRLLTPGGRLIVADGFSSRTDFVKKQKEDMHQWLNGWGVESLETKKQFEVHLEKNGFKEISYQNVTENVMPSSKRLYWISFPAVIFSTLGEWVGLRKKIQTNNIKAAYYQYTTLKNRLWEYGIFKAVK